MDTRRISRSTAAKAVLSLVCCSLACSSATPNDDITNAAAGGGYGGASTPRTNTSEGLPTLAFEPATVSVSVLGQTTVTVRVSPPTGQLVSFALIGNSLDASLEAAQVAVDDSGLASVKLNAPSTPASFAIRASVGRSAVAETQVVVQPAATGSLEVVAKYSGSRSVSTYGIVVFPGQDCASVSNGTSTSSSLAVTTSQLPVRVDGLPLATPFAVVVKGDSTRVFGCATTRGITNASTVTLEVVLEDTAVQLQGVSIGVALTIDEGFVAFQDSLRTSMPTLLSAFGDGGHDLVELLAAMESTATGSLRQEFMSLRSTSGWDDLVVSAYAARGGVDLLRRKLRDWLLLGIESLAQQPGLELRLDLGPSDYAAPRLVPLRIGGIDAVSDLSMHGSPLSFNVEAGDRLNWSSTLHVPEAVFVDALTSKAASAESSVASGVPGHLAKYLDCDDFAMRLDKSALPQNANSHVCTSECLATLCRSGLAAMYQRATAAAFGDPTTPLLINASGKMVVDETGRPALVTGNWIGVFGTEEAPVTLSGTYVTP